MRSTPCSTRTPDEAPPAVAPPRHLGGGGDVAAAFPPAARFTETFNGERFRAALRTRLQHAVGGGGAPLAVQLRVPGRADDDPDAQRLVGGIESELARLAQACGCRPGLAQLLVTGAGAATLSPRQMARLARALAAVFRAVAGVSREIELDFRTLTPQVVARLRELGFDGALLHCRDGDACGAIDAPTSLQELAAAIGRLRAARFASVGVVVERRADVGGAGLPAALESRILQVARLRPDRLALAGVDRAAAGRLLAALAQQGYVHVGLDQFALAGDALAVARHRGRLHIDVQGLSTRADGDVLGIGPGAVGRVAAHCYQNARDAARYAQRLERGELPIERGRVLNRDDLVRRSVISSLVCHGRVDFESIALAHLVDARAYFACELMRLAPLARDGTLTIDEEGIEITPAGAPRARVVAAVFDRERSV